jgi:hypothetical protein
MAEVAICDLDERPGELTRVEEPSIRDVDEARLAEDPHGGGARFEILRPVAGDTKDELDLGGFHLLALVPREHIEAEVAVSIDEPGEEREISEIEHARARRHRETRADAANAIGLDQNHAGGNRQRFRAGDEEACLQDDRGG